jgi:translation elongation factor P/translation initiation factor 5A
MKIITLKSTALALLPVAMLTLASCSSTPKGETTTSTDYQPGVPGGVMVTTYKKTATVTGIDKATRNVTLVDKAGTLTIFKAGPEVANFDQIEVGDQVKTTVTAQLVVSMRKPGEPSDDGLAATAEWSPLGAKPGNRLESTVEITAKVKSLDVKHQKATLLFPDGTTKTFKVRKDVDLTKQTVGADVIMRVTEAVAISVEKP